MKKILSPAVLLVVCINIVVAESKLPSVQNPLFENIKINNVPPLAVLNSFQSLFGNVPVRQWKHSDRNHWRALFLRNGIPTGAIFTSTGALVKVERLL